MGMFDYIRCKWPLLVAGANEIRYQTKDTPAQVLDLYEIREDGTLWHEVYDTEDRSDQNAKRLHALRGIATRVNKRWLQVTDFIGELRFYCCACENSTGKWLEWSAYFVDGKLREVNRVED